MGKEEHNIEVPKHEQTVGHIINLFFEEYVEKIGRLHTASKKIL